MITPRLQQRSVPIFLHAATVLVVLASLSMLFSRPEAEAPDFNGACREGDPWFVAASYRAQAARGKAPSIAAPSLILFRDTPSNRPHYTLATFREIGTVWGLAYRSSEPAVYAGTFHKRAMPYGPDGVGAIYRIDLSTGEAALFVTVPDAGTRDRGSQMADGTRYFDESGSRLVGRSALGDIDLSTDESELYAMNLYSRRIYRFAMPTGGLIGSFDHGAAAEPWSDDARPFGLAFHEGRLYHGVVSSRGVGDDFVAKIYRSNSDGSDMAEVATLDLGYSRPSIRLRQTLIGATDWRVWQDQFPKPKIDERPPPHSPQPMLTDIEFSAEGEMVIGLRDRFWDVSVQWVKDDETAGPTVQVHPRTTATPSPPLTLAEDGLGFGDILIAHPEGDDFGVQVDPEFFDDTNALQHAESALGGLASVPDTLTVVGTAYGVADARSDLIVGQEGAYWWDSATGNKMASEAVGRPGSFRPYSELLKQQGVVLAHCTLETYLTFYYNRDVGSLGDVEALCAHERTVPTGTPSPSASSTELTPVPPTTVVPPSDTPTPTIVTPTKTRVAATATSTLTPRPKPVYLPILLKEECQPRQLHADVALVIDASLTMEDLTRSQRPKIDAAREAAQLFVDHMSFPSDQAAVVSFNEEAHVLQPLTGDRERVRDALDRIATAEYTRIDLGLKQAHEQVLGARHDPQNVPVIILLTDGKSNPVPESQALDAAAEAKQAGITVFTVGLGPQVAEPALREMASAPDHYWYAPDGDDLGPIYDRIAVTIPCPPEDFWGKR